MIIDDVWFELKNGCKVLLRSPIESDADCALEYWKITAAETDYLLHYPEECSQYTAEGEKELFAKKNASPDEAMIMCVIGEKKIIGNCEIAFFKELKMKHRAYIALSVVKEYWNQGIGTRMLQELIRLAESKEGIIQIELDVVESNSRAIRLYEKMGFRITGTHPNAFRLKDGSMINNCTMIRRIVR